MGWTAAGLVIAAIGTGASIHQGEQQASAQRGAIRDQNEAQNRAQASASSARLDEEDKMRALEREQTETGRIRDEEAAAGAGGAAGNLLTGTGGVDTNRLNLGRTSILGG